MVQLGYSGVIADMFRSYVARSDNPFQLEAIATAAHPELRGKNFSETPLEGPAELDDVPVIGMLDAIENTDAPLIFSGLQAKMAARYEDRAAAGRLMVTNASANRGRPNVALVSAFTNPQQIDELYAEDREGYIIAGGNCVSAIISVPLATIHRDIGIESMSVKTMQGWSGAGRLTVPEGQAGNTPPVEGDEQEKIQSEPNRMLSPSLEVPEGILIGAEPRRAPWVRGHYARIALNLSRPTSEKEIAELLRDFEAPEELAAARPYVKGISKAGGGDRWPNRHHFRPVKVEHGSLLRTDLDPPKLHRVQPMRVQAHILEFDPEDPSRIIIEVAGDNLIQGAVGGNMLNAIYAYTHGYLS